MKFEEIKNHIDNLDSDNLKLLRDIVIKQIEIVRLRDEINSIKN